MLKAFLIVFLPLIARAGAPDYCSHLRALEAQGKLEQESCGIVRGPRAPKKIALVFTGGSFAEGYSDIKRGLDGVKGKASFFLTGDFLRTAQFQPLISELRAAGHYLGPHSDKHLVPVDDNGHTRVHKAAFLADLAANLTELKKLGVNSPPFWIVPGESYNEEIARWSLEGNLKLINYSDGTRSNADYMEDDDPHFVSNEKILESILVREKSEGLGGFLLLLHLGAGPGRTKPFSLLVPQLLTVLKNRGYEFVRIDQLFQEDP